jgi:hypothetical protein
MQGADGLCGLGDPYPRPTVMLTFAPGASLLPGFGFCASTLPFFLAEERFLVTLPTLQCALLILALAFLSVRPRSFGTMHFALNVAVAALSTVIDSGQGALPVHAPLQPLKTEVAVGFDARVTAVP